MPDEALAHWRKTTDARRAAARRVERKRDAYASAYPGRREGARATTAPATLPEGWAAKIPTFTKENGIGREPRGVRRGAQRDRGLAPRAGRRIGRSHAVEQHVGQGVEEFRARRLRRPLCAFRHSRTWNGRDHERHGRARRRHPVRRHVPDLLRLHASGDSPRGVHEAARDLHLHARLDRPGRRRADAPADRAALGAARDSGPDGDPAGRRERDGGGVAGGGRASRRAGRARADAAEAAFIDREKYASADGVAKGGYVLADPPTGRRAEGRADVVGIGGGADSARRISSSPSRACRRAS